MQVTMLDVDRRKRARLQLIEKKDENDADDGNSSPTNAEIPSGFICPLTMDVMVDPVLDAEGNTYERSAVLKWLEKHHSSPVSRQPLNHRMVIANNALRESIHEYMGDEWVQRKTKENSDAPSAGSFICDQSRFRSKIDCFLQNTCSELGGLDLKLNADGCCAFRYDNITIVLDVPEQVGVFCLYTKDLLAGMVGQEKLFRRALELNFLQGDTRGGCLSTRKNAAGQKEIMFSYTDRVPEVSARDFSNILLNFVETSAALREKLLRPQPISVKTATATTTATDVWESTPENNEAENEETETCDEKTTAVARRQEQTA